MPSKTPTGWLSILQFVAVVLFVFCGVCFGEELTGTFLFDNNEASSVWKMHRHEHLLLNGGVSNVQRHLLSMDRKVGVMVMGAQPPQDERALRSLCKILGGNFLAPVAPANSNITGVACYAEQLIVYQYNASYFTSQTETEYTLPDFQIAQSLKSFAAIHGAPDLVLLSVSLQDFEYLQGPLANSSEATRGAPLLEPASIREWQDSLAHVVSMIKAGVSKDTVVGLSLGWPAPSNQTSTDGKSDEFKEAKDGQADMMNGLLQSAVRQVSKRERIRMIDLFGLLSKLATATAPDSASSKDNRRPGGFMKLFIQILKSKRDSRRLSDWGSTKRLSSGQYSGWLGRKAESHRMAVPRTKLIIENNLY